VRRYVPELKGLDKKYIYEPWKAPLAGQKKGGVRIQGDGKEDQEGVYPKPMFDFVERRTICLDGMKKAYKVGLYGNDPKVIDEMWRELFDDDAEGPTEGTSFKTAMGNGVGSEDKIREGLDGRDEHDGAIAEDERGAKEKGGESKGGDKNGTGSKRERGQGTLDGLAKRSKR
jgi:cryptochrome